MNVPQSTIEKPLTVVDYIAGLAACTSIETIGDYANACPLEVRQDFRFERAVAGRMADIKVRQR